MSEPLPSTTTAIPPAHAAPAHEAPARETAAHEAFCKEQLEFAWKVNTDLMENIKLADSKGAFVLTFVVGVASAVLFAVGARLSDNPAILEAPPCHILIPVVGGAYLAMAFIAAYFAATVIRPRNYGWNEVDRRWPAEKLANIPEPTARSRIFFNPFRNSGVVGSGHISQLKSRGEFESRLANPRQRLDDLVARVGLMAWIDQRKYRTILWALRFAGISFALALLLVFITFVASARVPKKPPAAPAASIRA